MVEPGTILQNRYRVERLIGRGGMGAVYEAVDERLGHRVALKETLVTDEPLRRAFEREARILAGLHHHVLPGVSDHFVEEEGQYLVMRFIPGDDLGEALARQGGPFPVAQVLAWGERLLDALDYLHSHQPPIVHRDIKPQNLKVTARGEIILLDFGLAKGGDVGVTETLTMRSVYGYTPRYAPPEQIQGVGTEPRSDLYALGATLYHLVTGVKPADARERAAAAFNRHPDPLRPAHVVTPGVPLGLSALLGQALALAVEERPTSAATMRQHLGRITRALALADEPTASVTPALSPLATFAEAGPGLRAHHEAPTRLVAAVEPTPLAQPPVPLPRSSNQVGLFVTTTMGLLLVLGLLSLGVWWAIEQLQAAAPNPTEPAVSQNPSPTVTLTLPAVVTETPPAPSVLTATQTLTVTATLTLTATATSEPPTPTPSPSPTRVLPSATALPPSATPSPSATPTETPTATPTETPPLPTSTPQPVACTIPPAPMFEGFWEANQDRIGCPTGSSIVLPQLAEELFEGGHMFWRNNPDQVYVVFDRSLSSGQEFLSGSWITDPGWTWDGSFPEGTGMETPPGRYEPVRGFGYIWRNFLDAQNGPLGWALDREYSFPNVGVIQPFEGGLIFKGSAPPLYMLLDNGTFYRSQ